ncbi:MAG TPA: hypothetical protein VGD72_03875 [Mycobacteriales bacterium]|jgi:hypothetical protein
MMRRTALLLLVVVAVLTGTAGTAGALSLGTDCKEPPSAVAPGNPIGGNPAQGPTGGDPFAARAQTTVYREYGLVVPSWTTYDLGCGPALSRDPTAVVTTFFANGLEAVPTMIGGTIMSALAHGVLGWTGLEAVDRSLGQVSADLRDAVWADAVAIVGLLVMVWWAYQLLRGDLRRLTLATVYVVCAVAFFALLIGYPQKAGSFFDGAMRSAVGTAYGVPSEPGAAGAGPAAADRLIGGLYESASYRTWCWGMVGTDTRVGARYCAPLWRATHFSYAEARQPADRQAALRKGKASDFAALADGLRRENPGAYQILQGKDWVVRSAAAGLSAALWMLLSFYPVWGLGMVFGSLLLFRLTVALAPALGPVFLHPAMARSAKAMANVLFGGIVNTVIFTFATAVYLRLAASLLADGAGLDLPLRLALLLILTVALWVLTKPWRRLTGMGRDLTRVIDRAGYRVSGEGIRDAAAAAARGAASAGAVAAGAGSVMTALTVAEMADGRDGGPSRHQPARPEVTSAPGTVYVPSTREPAGGAVPAALPSGVDGGPAVGPGSPGSRSPGSRSPGSRSPGSTSPGGWTDVPPIGPPLRPATAVLTEDGAEVYAIYSASDHAVHPQFLPEEPAGQPPPPDGAPPMYRRGTEA